MGKGVFPVGWVSFILGAFVCEMRVDVLVPLPRGKSVRRRVWGFRNPRGLDFGVGGVFL